MARIVTFIVMAEIEDDLEVGRCELDDVLNQLEDIINRRNYSLYDSEIIEED